MNTKAEQYNKFVKEHDFKAWYNVTEVEVRDEKHPDEMRPDKMHTVLYESVMEIEKQNLPTRLVIDDSIFVMLQVRLAAAVVKEANRAAVIEHINKLNERYKVFKYYISGSGDIIIESCIPSGPQNFDCNMVHVVIDVIFKHLKEEYKEIMKLVWSN